MQHFNDDDVVAGWRLLKTGRRGILCGGLCPAVDFNMVMVNCLAAESSSLESWDKRFYLLIFHSDLVETGTQKLPMNHPSSLHFCYVKFTIVFLQV